MRAITAREHRERGGTYPAPDWASWSAYRELVAGPLGEDDALGALARFPGPAALRRLLREGTPVALHPPERDAMFAGLPERIWAWPGVREMGAVILLDPWPLSPLRARGPEGYVVGARTPPPEGSTIYVPDEECARAAAPCETFAEARARMPSDWRERLDAALARIDAYVDEVAALSRALDALGALPTEERAVRLAERGLAPEDLERPVFLAPPEARERLRGLAREAAT